eukprot:SAG31_NODE_1812_length_7215_cov_1.891934_1_plen_2312_part_01
MRFTRSRVELAPLSSVLTVDFYYEQTVLLGLRIGDEGPEPFSVDPSNGVLCINPRCIPQDEWLASEDYAQQQIAEANAAAAGGSLEDQWALDRMPIEVASELFLFFGASDSENKELINLYRDSTIDRVRRIATINVANDRRPTMEVAGPELSASAAAAVVYSGVPATNLVAVPPLVYHTEPVPFHAYVEYPPPLSQNLTAAYGPVGGGTTVHIIGVDLFSTDDLRCKFRDGVVSAEWYMNERKVVQCKSPYSSEDYAGPVSLSLAMAGVEFLNSVLTFTYYTEPTVLNAFPVAGGWAGGTEIRLSGRGIFGTPLARCRLTLFQNYGLANETFGLPNATALGTFHEADGSLRCFVPALADTGLIYDPEQPAPFDGWVFNVQVSLNGQQYAPGGRNFTYFAQTVTAASIIPPLGPTTGGTSITINGNGFVDTHATFCYIRAVESGVVYDDWMPMQLTNESIGLCTSGVWEVPEVVTFGISLNRYDVYNDGLGFEYYEPVRLQNVNPSQGPATGVQPDGDGVIVSITTDLFFPFVNSVWLRCRFGGEQGGVTTGTFVDEETITCPVPFAAGNAGAVELAVSLNGQQYHPATEFSFHYTPVVFSLNPANTTAAPPIGPDTGGSTVSIVAFGASPTAETSFVCRFGEIEVPAAGISPDGSVVCAAPPLPGGVRGDSTDFIEVVVQLSVDDGLNFSPTTAETDPCACYGYGLELTGIQCVGGTTGGGPRCWNTTSNIYRYYPIITDLAFESTGIVAAALVGSTTDRMHIRGTGILATEYLDKLQCELSAVISQGQLASDAAVAAAEPSVIVRANLDGQTVSCPVVPSNIPRDVQVAISLNGQQFSTTGPRFNYYDPSIVPRVHRIRPQSGPLAGGTLVTVNGWNVANVPTLSCRWMRNGTTEVIATASATFISTAAATCVAPGVGVAIGRVYAYVQLSNDPATGWSTEIRNEYTYTTSDPVLSTVRGTGEPPGLSGTHIAGTIGTARAQAYDAFGVAQDGGGDSFTLMATNQPDDEVFFESWQEDLQNGFYNLYYNVTVAGEYDVVVSLGGAIVESGADESLPRHPYSITVLPDASNGANAVAEGPGLYDWYIWDGHNRNPGQFTIQARDRFSNPRLGGGDEVAIAFDPPADGPNIVVNLHGIEDHDNGTYTATYSTTFAGDYHVHIQLNSVPIYNDGAALRVHPDVIFPERSYANISGSRIAGNTLGFDVQAVDQYGNLGQHGGAQLTFQVEVEGYTDSTPYQSPVLWRTTLGGTRDMHLDDNEDGTYSVTFSPTLAGQYRMQVRICYDELGGETFAPPPPGLWMSDGCAFLGPDDGWTRGVTNTTVVAAAPYGPNTLVYGDAVNSARSGEAFSFNVEARDIYNNRLLIGGASITGSLFQTVYNIQTAFLDRSASEPPCHRDDEGECAAIQDTDDGLYSVSFRVTLSGAYKVFIAINDVDVSQRGHAGAEDDGGFTWFILDVDAADAFAPFCVVTGEYECSPTPDCSGHNTAGLRTSLSVDAYDRFRNERTTGGDQLRMRYTPIIDWNGAVESTIVDLNFPSFEPGVIVDDAGSGDYEVSYSLTKTGDYLVYLDINNMVFPESPFPFTVGPSDPYPGTSLAAGVAFDGVTAGNTSHFIVTSYDYYHNLVPYGGRNITMATQPLDIFGNEIVNFGPEETEGGGGYEALHDFSDGPGYVTPFEVVDTLDGNYEVGFIFYVKAGIRISIFMDGDEIGGSPYASICTPGPLRVNNSIIVGAAALNGIAGIPAIFNLQSRDQYGNELDIGGCGGTGRIFLQTAEVNNSTINMYQRDPNDRSIERMHYLDVTDTQDGAYVVMYNLTVAGSYNMSASLEDVHLLGSPWLLSIVPAVPDLQNSYAIGPGVTSALAGIETSVWIVTVDYWTNECIEGGDEVHALIRGPRYPPEITAVDLGNGTYGVHYTLDLVGQYNVFVQLNDYRFGLSPLEPFVSPGPAAAHMCIASGSATHTINAGEIAELYIQSRDANDNPRPAGSDTFEAILEHNETDVSGPPVTPVAVPLDVVDGVLYGHVAIFAPAGEWTMSVRLLNQAGLALGDISGSPFTVTLIEAPISPAHCTVTGDGATNFTAGDQGHVVITSRDRFGNLRSYSAATAVTFSVQIAGPGDITSSPPAIAGYIGTESLRDGRYQFSWSADISGTYILTAELDGISLQDCPLAVNVTAGQTVLANSMFDGAVSRGEAGIFNTLMIHTHDISNNPRAQPLRAEMTASVIVLGHVRTAVVEDMQNGTVLIAYNITHAGAHTLYITFGGDQDFSGSLTIFPGPLDYSTSRLTGSGVAGAYAATQAFVVVEPTDRFGNHID